MSSSNKFARTLGLAGLMAVVAMLVIASVGAASALAAPEWGECFKEAGGLYKDSLCNEKTGGEFEWAPFATAVAVKSEGTLELTDEKGGVFGEAVTVECTGKNEGTVGPGSEDKVTNITDSAGNTTISCTKTAGICSSPTAKAVHLPWVTKLELIAGVIRDVIVSGTGGEPGWSVTCSGSFTDECVGKSNTGIQNVATGVNAIFDANSPNVKCSRTNATTGKVRGTNHILNPPGVQLSVK